MTNTEMALAIGEKLIRLRHQRAAYVGVLSGYKTPEGKEIPFREMAQEILESPQLSHSVAEQTLSLRLLIELQVDSQAMLQALYRLAAGELDEV